jgi:hypothetical protein
MHRFAQVIVFALNVVCLLGLGRSASAQSLVSLEGLTFHCPGCLVGEKCELSSDGRRTYLDCDQALKQLLERRAAGNYENRWPSPEELSSFLTTESRKSEVAVPAIRLLFKTKRSFGELKKAAPAILQRYSGDVENVLRHERVSQTRIDELLQFVETRKVSIQPDLLAIIVARSSSPRINALLSRLSVSSFEEDIFAVNRYSEALATLKEPLVIRQQLREVSQVLDACNRSRAQKTLFEFCLPQDIKAMSGEVHDYLYRVQMQTALAIVKSGDVNSRQAIDIFSRTNFSRYDTPDMHETLLQVLRSFDPELMNQPVNPREWELVREMAAKDPFIADQLGLFLTYLARSRVVKGEHRLAMQTIEDSYQLSSSGSEARSQIIQEILRNSDFKEAIPKPDYDRLLELAKQGGDISLPWIMIAGAVLIGLSVLLLSLRKRVDTTVHVQLPQGEISSDIERLELSELLRFFDLPPFAVDEDLTKAFRAKAKQLHPDNEEGSVDAFCALQKKHERAKELLERYRFERAAGFQ